MPAVIGWCGQLVKAPHRDPAGSGRDPFGLPPVTVAGRAFRPEPVRVLRWRLVRPGHLDPAQGLALLAGCYVRRDGVPVSFVRKPAERTSHDHNDLVIARAIRAKPRSVEGWWWFGTDPLPASLCTVLT